MDKSKSKDSKSFAAALRILTRRDRSETELRQKLVQFGFSLPAIDTAIEKCRDYNYLDDRRYAVERARALMRSGRGVGPRIMVDLRRRGINENIAQQAVETAASEFPAEDILRQQLTRRFPTFNYDTADARERRRVVSFFQRRGFGLDEIFQVIKEHNHIP
ncbi:regulatory protein RecX [uncultured Desulfuromusa sp.]|uniref:regulatory protein RecX n=1 Tax=uncultured Desulfuromusa sp. TaxID=219183 RepID=UPI002AA8A772|nr:regulatory protein RecX [uncultured Desulfuromusa sp.]